MSEILSSIRGVLQTQLFEISGTPINLATLVLFTIILGASLAVSRILQRGVKHFLRVRGVEDVGSIGVTTRLVHYAVMMVGLGIGLNTLGINLTALFTAGAVFAVAMGFAMQQIVQNFVSGLILLTERSIKPGDVIEVEGRMVRVTRMDIRATIARTLEDEDLIIPNNQLVQSTVKNYTLRDPYFRIRVDVGVIYGSDMKLVFETLEETARSLAWISPEREPRVLMTAFGSSSVDFQVSVWVEDPWNLMTYRSQLHDAIWWALKNVGVTIAFPQLDVHFDPPVMKAIETVGEPAGREDA